MDEHALTQMIEGVSNKGLPPGCYTNKAGIAAKQRRIQTEAINKRIDQIEARLDRIEALIAQGLPLF